MSQNFAESTEEEAALAWLGELDYAAKHGPHIAPGSCIRSGPALVKLSCRNGS